MTSRFLRLCFWLGLPILALALTGMVGGCSSDATPETAEEPSEKLGSSVDDGANTEPILISAGPDLSAAWDQFVESAVSLDRAVSLSIPGFEPFNDVRIALSDGRFIVRGRWDRDAVINSSYQRNPDSLPEGADNPVIDSSDRPVRLFVYDQRTDALKPVSHTPSVFPYSTAMSVGDGPDIVLDVVVLDGELSVAYITGFSGAAYDIQREVYTAPIPPG